MTTPDNPGAMTLRAKLLSLFVLLAAGPLLAIGLIGYALSERAVAAQLEAQTRVLAERTAEEIVRRVRLVESDLLLIGGNAESERLLRLRQASGTAEDDEAAARRAAETFLDAAWAVLGASYTTVELLDAAGTPLLRRGEGGPAGDGTVEHVVAAYASDSPAVRLGTVRAHVRLDALLPADARDARFGRDGVAAIVHRDDGRVLHFAGGGERTVRRLADVGLAGVDLDEAAASGAVRTGGGRGTDAGDGARIGWLTVLDVPPLAVLSLADRGEFAAPFDRQRTMQLALVLLLAGAVVPTGWFLLRRATRSLDELTAAADRVGQGDFMPELPRAGRDEVGRLTVAFSAMTQEIRNKVEEIERSRQLAAVGEFAAELSHEIRNPLTAVKLNLQRIERMLERGDAPADAAGPLRIALREIARLDRVVHGSLRLGRPAATAPAERRPVSVRALVDGALEPLREQLDAQRIRLETRYDDVSVTCDAEELTGALLNLLLNAVEAMPDGGTLRVHTAYAPTARHVDIYVTDEGRGIAAAVRAGLFRPFTTTKRDGTGLGLALAHRAVEAHGGALTLDDTGAHGTTFRIRLPVVPAEVPA